MVDQPSPIPPTPPIPLSDSPPAEPVAPSGPEKSRVPDAKMTDDDVRRISLIYLSFLALAVGIVTGFGAFAFRELIGLLHNIFFLGKFSFNYNSNLFTPASPWGVLVILAPVIGSVAVTFLITKFAPEARGHGVPEVMNAIYYHGGGDSACRRGCQIIGLGYRARQRLVFGSRRPDHSDRFRPGIDIGPGRSHAARAAQHSRCRRGRRRHRGDIQY